MAFFNKAEKEAVLFSPLEGHLLFNGKPASNAKITLWIKWKDIKGDFFHFKADENGYFSIPEKKSYYKENPLAQIVITQEITVEYNNETYLIWTLSKTSTLIYEEFGGKPDNLKCELLDDLEATRTNNILMGTNCKWITNSISKMSD